MFMRAELRNNERPGEYASPATLNPSSRGLLAV